MDQQGANNIQKRIFQDEQLENKKDYCFKLKHDQIYELEKRKYLKNKELQLRLGIRQDSKEQTNLQYTKPPIPKTQVYSKQYKNCLDKTEFSGLLIKELSKQAFYGVQNDLTRTATAFSVNSVDFNVMRPQTKQTNRKRLVKMNQSRPFTANVRISDIEIDAISEIDEFERKFERQIVKGGNGYPKISLPMQN